MIPLRVSLKNFLCHKEQTFDFDDHPVWLLHGPNGVGKSAVFDAMAYALFAEHKRREGGTTVVADLIRHGETGLRVEFVFEVGGRRYRIWRTRTRSASGAKQGVVELTSGGPVPVRDITSARDVEKWVEATLGLNYDTFVSAMLLRQGAAERLIDAKKEDRRDIFRGFIDLDPFIRLHKAAAEVRTKLNGEESSLQAQLDGGRDVSDDELAAAAGECDRAEAAWREAITAAAELRDWSALARQWEQLDGVRGAVRKALAAAADRAQRSAELDQVVARLRELRQVVPRLQQVVTLHSRSRSAVEEARRLTEGYQGLVKRSAELTAVADLERQRATKARGEVTDLDARLGTATGRRDRLGEQVERADRAEDLHRRLTDLRTELSGYEPGLDAGLTTAESAVADAQAAHNGAPHLATLVQRRAEYHRAVENGRTAAIKHTEAQSEVERRREAQAQATADAATGRSIEAARAATVADTRLTDARDDLARFTTVDGAAVCSVCRQPIDEVHAARERATLEGAVAAAATDAEHRRTEADRAAEDAVAAGRQLEQTRIDLRAAEATRDDASRAIDDADRRAADCHRVFDRATAELAEAVAARVAPISTAGFPTAADVSAARSTAADLGIRTRARDDLRKRCQARDQAAAGVGPLEQAVAAVGAPADVTAARAELVALDQTISTLTAERGRVAQAADDAERAREDAMARHGELLAEQATSAASVARAEAESATAERDLNNALASLPTGATEWDPDRVAAELRDLEAGPVERDHAALADDRALRAERERQLADVERQIAEAIPPAARRPAAELAPALVTAERQSQLAQGARDAAVRAAADLEHRRIARAELHSRHADAARGAALHKRLVELLGPDGLQLDQVRQAERRIVELANGLLGRVSLGELRLEPPDPASTLPFDLKVRRLGCPDPIGVGNLSGGQRCRVAVALALAVCRYACGQARPLESVVIDEAFANLDRDGRMAMVELFRDGRVADGVFRRIILVSHHDDVAAAFPIGYRLTNDAGTTTATRFG